MLGTRVIIASRDLASSVAIRVDPSVPTWHSMLQRTVYTVLRWITLYRRTYAYGPRNSVQITNIYERELSRYNRYSMREALQVRVP